MAINGLTGNFQPLTEVSGRPLPRSENQEKPTEVAPDNVEAKSVDNAVKPNADSTGKKADAEKASEQVQALNQIARNIQRRLSFEVDETLGKTVVSVIDKETDKLIRQIPPEELLVLSKRLKELNEKAFEDSPSGLIIQREA